SEEEPRQATRPASAIVCGACRKLCPPASTSSRFLCGHLNLAQLLTIAGQVLLPRRHLVEFEDVGHNRRRILVAQRAWRIRRHRLTDPAEQLGYRLVAPVRQKRLAHPLWAPMPALDSAAG